MSANELLRLSVDESHWMREYYGPSISSTNRRNLGDTYSQGATHELAASIAHEVNQPLAAVVTNAESCLRWLVRDEPNLERARKAAERVIRDAHHASNVIRSVRGMLRGWAPHLSCIDANELVAAALETMQDELHGHQIVVETILDEDIAPITGDRIQLQQVMVNLIRNAIEAMRETDHQRLLQVRTALDADGTVLVAIADSGIGLDTATMSRIFEPFFTTKTEGMGLGLSICRSIVEKHGGRLWASSRPSRGSTFQFTIPRVASPAVIAL